MSSSLRLLSVLLCLCFFSVLAVSLGGIPDQGALSIQNARGDSATVSQGKVVYRSKAGKTWTVKVSDDDFYQAALIVNDGLLLSRRSKDGVFVEKYSTTGKLVWRKPPADEWSSFYNWWPETKLVGYVAGGSGASMYSRYDLLDATTGKRLNLDFSGEVVGMSKDKILALYPPDNFITEDVDVYVQRQWKAEINFLPYVRHDFKGKRLDLEKSPFPTPPRPHCGQYVMPPEVVNPEAARLATGLFAQSEVRGEYIFAHRTDHCGKFTYKFHWTKNTVPAPEILDGWQ